MPTSAIKGPGAALPQEAVLEGCADQRREQKWWAKLVEEHAGERHVGADRRGRPGGTCR